MSYPVGSLGDVATFINGDRGKNYPSKGSFIPEGVPFISAGNLLGGELNPSSFNYISEESFDLLSNGKVKENDILFCLRGSLGKFALVKNIEKGAIASSLVIIRNNEKVDISFLKHYLGSPLCKREINQFENGAAQPNLSAKDLKSFKIPLPPLAEQKRIAAILDKADAIRQKRQQAINLADDFLRSVFLDMFGDPKINPKNWDINELGGYVEYLGDIGSNGSNANVAKNLVMSDIDDYAIMVRTVNLNANNFENNVKYISKETYNYFSKSKIYGGELIMNKIGSAGKFWIMPNLNRPVSLGLNQFVIRLKNLNIQFLFHCLSTKYGQLDIASRTRGAVTQSITKSEVRNIPIIYPPMELQEKFELVVKQVELLKLKYSQKNGGVEAFFNSLSQKAFAGEL